MNKSVILFLVIFCFSCASIVEDREDEKNSDATLFRFLSSDDTGIDFKNTIVENDSIHVLDNYYIYNGGGVGVGDFNNDSRPDLFFAGNLTSSKLYLNQDSLKFRDITIEANVSTSEWISGVSIVDLDGNGWDDIYLSSGVTCEYGCKNLLFMNQGLNENGIPIFKEEAELVGLADTTHVTQTLFFDFDNDNDLDAYVLRNTVDGLNKNTIREKGYFVKKSHTEDKLYRNEGMENGKLSFVDISEKSGIVYGGYGLGVSVSDFNNDGWPDLYVSNDFATNDLVFVNQRDGTFNEIAPEVTQHQSYNGMGCDIADINNDGLYDVMVMDMLPEDNKRQKTMLMGANRNRFNSWLKAGYQPQFVRNTLQLGNGTSADGEILPFSEIAQLSGVNKTDWSWAPLLADFDNDGDKDIYISNGFVRDMTDLDFINNKKFATQFGTSEAKWEKLKEMYNQLDGAYLSNYMYSNKGSLEFEDVTKSWGVHDPSYSQGAVYSDLDNDGDLDLIVSNINKKAFLIENRAQEIERNNFLQIKLKGNKGNVSGLGSKITIFQGNELQTQYHSVIKGYLSSVENVIHFGLGKNVKVDSVEVLWPGNKRQISYDLPVNELVTIEFEASKISTVNASNNTDLIFTEIEIDGLDYVHKENYQNDFAIQPLLLNMYSENSPPLAVSDLDKNGLEDVFVGSSIGEPSFIYLQRSNGEFKKQELGSSKETEDVDALWFDFDKDGDDDLYVVSGGSFHQDRDIKYKDRLYINSGGKLELTDDVLPDLRISGSVVSGADFDQDGDIDLFVGGDAISGKYPEFHESYILINDNQRFVKGSQELIPDLNNLGLVTSAIWDDFDNDGWQDLIVLGEWMPITIFKNNKGKLEKTSLGDAIDDKKGWWYNIRKADLDNDGDNDYVLGNIGMNTPFIADKKHSFELYAKDFDGNGTQDPIFVSFIKDTTGTLTKFPYHPLGPLSQQINTMKNRFRRHKSYAIAPIERVLTRKELNDAVKLQLNYAKSSVLMNLGNGKFEMIELPTEVQTSPVHAIEILDIDGDNDKDIIMAGNFRAAEDMGGWYDASLGNVLINDGSGNFSDLPARKSGLLLNGDVKDLTTIQLQNGKKLLIATLKNDQIKCFAF